MMLAVAACLLAGAFVGGQARADGVAEYGGGAVGQQLDSFNTVMREIYGSGRATLTSAARPLILVVGNHVTLLTEDGHETKLFTPPEYHKLKAVSHVVLGLVGALVAPLDGLEDGADWKARLERIDAAIVALEPVLAELGVTVEQEGRLRDILVESRAYIATTRPLEAPDEAAFLAFMDRIKPLWLADVMDGARAQLTTLDAVVKGWRARLSPTEWDRLQVLVTGARNPRAGNLQAAYFVRLLGEPALGDRVLYAENLFSPEAAMHMFGAVVMDRRVGDLLFGNPYRMEEDLLAYAAGHILDHLISGRPAAAASAK